MEQTVNHRDEDQNNKEPSEYEDISVLELPKLSEPEIISVCECLLKDSGLLEDTKASKRKQEILTQVSRTETYLRERRIPELMRFIVSHIMCHSPKNVTSFVVDLLDNCMIFRAGIGKAPVLFEERHLKAVVKSFDPGDRGWLSVGQVRRAYTTLGLTPKSDLEDRTPTSEVLDLLRDAQEENLLRMLYAGSAMEYEL